MNTIYTIECPWGSHKRLLEMPPEEYAALREAIPPLALPADREGIKDYFHCEFVGIASDIEVMAKAGLEPHVKAVRGVQMDPDIKEAARLLARGRTTLDAMPAVSVTNLTIPGVGLFEVAAVEVLGEACTDRLQRCLDDGWRIVAVCPARDARRPDYILGHRDRSKIIR